VRTTGLSFPLRYVQKLLKREIYEEQDTFHPS